jgi:hypothetical protein
LGRYLSRYLDSQTLSRIFIDDVQHSDWQTVVGPSHDKVITPDMIPLGLAGNKTRGYCSVSYPMNMEVYER